MPSPHPPKFNSFKTPKQNSTLFHRNNPHQLRNAFNPLSHQFLLRYFCYHILTKIEKVSNVSNPSNRHPYPMPISTPANQMSRREIAILACKILALWLFADAAYEFPSLLTMLVVTIPNLFAHPKLGAVDVAGALVSGLPALGPITAGTILWRGSSWFAGKMIPNDPTANPTPDTSPDTTPLTRPDINYDSVLSIALIAVGVRALIPSIRRLADGLLRIATGHQPFRDLWHDPAWQGFFWSEIITLAFALYLIFDSHGIAKIIHSLRRPDPEKSNSSESQPPADNV
jgi:hypothetical protein